MKLYIDKENLLSLLNQGEKEIVSELYEEVIRLIKRHLDLILQKTEQTVTAKTAMLLQF